MGQKIMALSHSGLEANHNKTAIKICESFPIELGFSFKGGLMLGFSSLINGINLTDLNRMTKNVKRALRITAEAITAEEPIP